VKVLTLSPLARSGTDVSVTSNIHPAPCKLLATAGEWVRPWKLTEMAYPWAASRAGGVRLGHEPVPKTNSGGVRKLESRSDAASVGAAEMFRWLHMNSAVETSVPAGGAISRVARCEVSLFRLNTLRVCYLILALGLGTYVWPVVISHTNEVAIGAGVRLALLAGLGATAVLGIRYPLQMLPLLLFELVWKAIYLIAFALPLWSAHKISAAVAEDIRAVVMVVVFVPLIPWRYVLAEYFLKRGDRWR